MAKVPKRIATIQQTPGLDDKLATVRGLVRGLVPDYSALIGQTSAQAGRQPTVSIGLGGYYALLVKGGSELLLEYFRSELGSSNVAIDMLRLQRAMSEEAEVTLRGKLIPRNGTSGPPYFLNVEEIL